MKKSKFTEAQILFGLKQAETRVKVEEVCQKRGISEAIFYIWQKNIEAWRQEIVSGHIVL